MFASRCAATDRRNRYGYFERMDVVSLNYQVLRTLAGSWTSFPAGFAQHPHALNYSQRIGSKARETQVAFERRARAIVADMTSRGLPFVLKDVRLARTLPLWEPLLRDSGITRLACGAPPIISEPSCLSCACRSPVSHCAALAYSHAARLISPAECALRS